MAGANAAYNQTQNFNKTLYDAEYPYATENSNKDGAMMQRIQGLDSPFKNQLSEQASRIANAGGRRGINKEIKGFHEMIWNNPNIPNELKQALADYAQYQPRVSGSGAALKQSMGGDVAPVARPKRKKKAEVATEPAPKAKRMKAKKAIMEEPAPAPTPTPAPPMTNARRRRVKAMEE